MRTGTIEFHEHYALLQILADDVTAELEARLYTDGWSLSTNGYVEDNKWYFIYSKNL